MIVKYYGGCDSGSTYTKCVILDENGKMVSDVTLRSRINSVLSAQDALDQAVRILLRIQLHALGQALKIGDFIRQPAHVFPPVYARFRYSPVRVSIWIISPVLMNSGTCRVNPVSSVAGL